MSDQKDLFKQEAYTVSDVIQGWKDMLNKVGSELNRLNKKKAIIKQKNRDGETN